jgi:hypothetical protein
MSSNDSQKFTADQIKALLGAPRLIRGENEADYWNWWAVFVEAYNPENLADWLEVNQLAVKHWEQERLQRCKSALIDGALFEALKNLVRPFLNPLIHEGLDYASRIARDYYLGDEKKKKQAREKVEEWGVTDDQILAEAMQLRGHAMVVFDRMDNYRTNSKRGHQKELDRRLRARRDGPDQSDSRQ